MRLIRLSRKPGTSLSTRMGSLPMLLTKSIPARMVSSEVLTPLMTSTASIMGTGLKKWRPRIFSGLLLTVAISVIGMAEVLVASTVFSPQASSNFLKISCLSSSFSKTASIARSTRDAFSQSVPTRIRPMIDSRLSFTFPFLINLDTDQAIFFRARFKISWLISVIKTFIPT